MNNHNKIKGLNKMERILLIKKNADVTWWEIDVTNAPIDKVLEIIMSEKGDDYEVKRKPGQPKSS